MGKNKNKKQSPKQNQDNQDIKKSQQTQQKQPEKKLTEQVVAEKTEKKEEVKEKKQIKNDNSVKDSVKEKKNKDKKSADGKSSVFWGKIKGKSTAFFSSFGRKAKSFAAKFSKENLKKKKDEFVYFVKNFKSIYAEWDFFKRTGFVMTACCCIVAFFILISILTSLIRGGKSKVRGRGGNVSSVTNVSVKTVEEETFREMLTLNAELKSLNATVTILSPVYGTLVSNNVRLGAEVKKGDVLGIVDGTDIGLSYKQAPVTAKTDGIVTGVYASVNQKVAATTALYAIEPESDFVLSASVSEKDADALSTGNTAVFRTAGNRDVAHTAKLVYVSPSVNTMTRSVEIEMDVDGDEENLKGLRSGNFVSAELVKKEYKGVFVVPNDAIKTYMNKDVVYTVDDSNIAHRVEITKGAGNENFTIIESGLKAGDRVVVQGSPLDGDKVQIL